MSPSESELRGALRIGEGEGVDPDAVISRARGTRHARRLRVGSIAAAVVVVGGVAAGVVTLRGGNAPSHVPSPRPGAAVAAQCPARPPHLMLPGGGGTGQFGADGPLFAKPVDRLLVCGYASSRVIQSTTLTGTAAQQVATSLNDAPTQPPTARISITCLKFPGTDLVLRSTGQPDVVLDVATCPIRATNGTAVRYLSRAPEALQP